ncbi:CDP-glycerol glycerophosphotransferase family protein [Aquibacillus koreensis]|uniref:CDP-glycerol glycerophosphotransferase family protein n=1 Tax=Aquibacillus koreensis TaxID=279446 RepID=A0A9X3WJJ9_9BACI|nr:glycosyltransferase [Aquibacillus koreensis]MCT2535293.1 CDP-glycerol glycerophosphotransferase family protein [Aquibacillus koreensis]MDC3419775.1 CDP-glycerol glycerophosphotransferase family protein [Aquibacillus koreensis]
MIKRTKYIIKTLIKMIRFLLKPLLDYMNNAGFKRRAVYAKHIRNKRINNKVIMYEAYHGKSMTGNPYAIFKKLYNDEKYSDYKHVWAMDSLENHAISTYENHKNIEFVKIHSLKYVKHLSNAKYLVNNTSFPYYFQKKEGQVYINTWHGTPLKKMGIDIEDRGMSDHANIQRNIMHTDYFVNPNKFTYEKLLKSHDIDGLYNGEVLDTGYPRIDLTLNTDKNEMKRILNLPVDKKIILYAPTWRGNSEHSSTISSDKIFEDIQRLRNKYTEEYEIILKVHYFVYKNFKEKGLEHLCVPNWVDTNELLATVDVLITDYSSIFFDFLPTKRPVIFYMYDKEEYERDRGFYLNLDELPGLICKSIEEIDAAIEKADSIVKENQDRYDQFLDDFNYNDDGKATERLIDIVFEQKESSKKLRTVNNKKKLLLYCGGFYNNGITISAINLTKYIDHDKYDVTVLDFGNKKGDQAVNISKMAPETRVIYRVGTWNMTRLDYFKHNLVNRKGLYTNFAQKNAPKEMYNGELKRLIGQADYDIVVDFGGYNKFWSILFAFSDIKWKSVFLHNDMMEEYNKKIDGKHKHRKNLNIIFSTYKYFDRIVSVAKSTRDVNMENLKSLVPNAKEKMVYVNNLIDYKRVLESKDKTEVINYKGNDFIITKEYYDSSLFSMTGVRQPESGDIVFANMARLSPEKDQEKLIRAFHNLLQQTDKPIKLYIIGSGPLESMLKRLVTDLDLEDKVTFTGQMDNPFSLINRADCFVLSSNYEGQGLVILESLILDKYVIATDVTGVRSVLEGGYGKLVQNDQDSLTEAMLEFLNDKVKFKRFDYLDYNEEALELFYKEVCNR